MFITKYKIPFTVDFVLLAERLKQAALSLDKLSKREKGKEKIYDAEKKRLLQILSSSQ